VPCSGRASTPSGSARFHAARICFFHQAATGWVKVSAIAISSARNSLSFTGMPPGPAGLGGSPSSSSPGRRRASSATTASSRGCAQEVCRRQPRSRPIN
jgi:hypothetical protein